MVRSIIKSLFGAKDMKTFTINRSSWLRASTVETLGSPSLLDENGNKCCLGFVCSQILKSDTWILDKADPSDMSINIKDFNVYVGGKFKNSNLSLEAMLINDNPDINDNEREAKLKALFNRYNYDLEFKNESI